MTAEELEYLKSREAYSLIESHIAADPLKLALRGIDRRVVSLIKVLQKCKKKLPSYYTARCILDQRAYEQCSSQATAQARTLGSGKLAIDLTCGLGVDTLELSRRFERVITIEIDPVRAGAARYNFSLLGVDNIDVINSSAEDFIQNFVSDEQIDLIYVDPSRRSESAERVYSLEDSSPNILELMPLLRQKARAIRVKLSPLFDIAQALRIFEGSSVEVISLDGECKEVISHVAPGQRADIAVTAIRSGAAFRFDFTNNFKSEHLVRYETNDYHYLHQPDVAFYKSRTVEQYMTLHYPEIEWLCEDYIFTQVPLEGFCGVSYTIEKKMAYQPKTIARELKALGIKRSDILLRNFPYSADNVARALGISQGGSQQMVCTMHNGQPTLFFVRLAK